MPDTATYRDDLHIGAGHAADGGDPVVITPERANWKYTGLRVASLDAGESRTIETGECEFVVLPLAGSCRVSLDSGADFELRGRESVFSAVSDFVYVGRGEHMTIASVDGGEFALPNAPSRRDIGAYRIDASDVAVEVRGAGSCTRQLTNFLAPGMHDSDRLTCVEVITPRGNWSSYPPHKHDDATQGNGEAELEEIYYFRCGPGDDAWGTHRTYDLAEGWDVTVTVRSDDVFLVPTGYHGPCMAPPDYDMWYLNVLAGPGAERSLAFSDDPRYAFARDLWPEQPRDPRVPVTGP
jgi:5-deoxy-glucuronate isomerase